MLVTLVVTVDLVMLITSGLLSRQACAALDVEVAAGEWIIPTVAATLVAVLTLRQGCAYAPSRLGDVPARLRMIAPAVLLGAVTAFICLALMPSTHSALRLWPLFWLLSATGLTIIAMFISAYYAQTPTSADRFALRVAVVGVNAYSQAFIARMAADPEQTALCIGLYDDRSDALGPASGATVPDATILGRLDDLVARSQRERIDAIVLAMPLSDIDRIMRLRAALRTVLADIYMGSEVLDLACPTGQMDRLGPNPVVKIARQPLTGWQALQKAALDRVLATVLLVAVAPVLALIALAIRLDSPGPILFRQPRLGFKSAMFSMLKFRTMYHHMADMNADQQTTRNDRRITRVGHILRQLSLDELPQLINVLRGEMSLIGPRPHAPNTKADGQLFHDVVADYALRHRVKPGMTGWAQVNGWRGETRTREQIEQRVAHDLHYIENWSMLFDIKIIVLTVLREVNSKTAF